jgi:tetratricopeptide (TPR) repeat protein
VREKTFNRNQCAALFGHAPTILSNSPSQPANPQVEEAVPGGIVGLMMRMMRVLSALRVWTTGHWLRGLIVATTLLTLIGLTIGGWAYLANVAIHAGELTADAAMKAYDEGRYEEARTTVSHMLTSGRLAKTEYGGPLLVLGALKIRDAEDQPTAERRRIEYSVAARYLNEARAYGLPKSRQTTGDFLLGKSLIESGQLDEGVRVLDDLTSHTVSDPAVALEALRILTDTCLIMPMPRLADALRHNDALLTNKSLSEDERTDALLQRVECLSRLDRFDGAHNAIARIPAGGSRAALIAIVSARLLLDEVETALQKLPTVDRPKAAGQYAGKIKEAVEDLNKAAKLDSQKKQLAYQSNYQLARAFELQGDREAALKQYARTRQFYGDTYEGLAASLMEADLLRQKSDADAALAAYRRVLESFAAIPVYRSHVLPVAKFRDRLIAALNDLQQHKQYKEALALIDRFSPIFSHAEQLELRGATLEQWGAMLLSNAGDENPSAPRERSAGLQRLRAAGVAFEQLADSRFATRNYTSDLWRGAQDFIQGQSFSSAIRLLDKYLENEPELRNAQALLRLGQCHLALSHVPQSISAFEECIEFHPQDSATFQARIDCARAYWQQGDTARAEQLLRYNITGSTLKPASPEWRDSLFQLGTLLHEQNKYEEAIDTLENAIERYPEDPQRLVAQYMIGESYRRWAQDYLADARNVSNSNDRDKCLREATKRLNTAFGHFEEVQRAITLKTHDIHGDPLMGTMLRNCYMFEGSVLFDLGKYKEAIEAYSNVSSLYPDEPFVLETFVQIANCWRRLDKHENARGAVKQAQIALDRFPSNSDFASTTVLNRDEWKMLLGNMSKW